MSDCSVQGKNLYAPKASIMVVDDNSMNLKVFAKLLKDTGISVDQAESGAECLDMIAKKHYDLIFMDHMMPVMDGIEAFHAIRSMDSCNKEVKVIALTANTAESAGDLYISEGFTDYLSKPVKPDVLKSMIIRHIARELLEDTEGTDSNGARCGSVLSDEVQLDKILSDKALDSKSDINTDSQIELPDIAGFDWELAESHFNDRETLWETLHSFYLTLKRDADRLSEQYNLGIAGGDLGQYKIGVHSMKSTSRLVGLAELSDMAKALEEASDRGDVKYIIANHDKFVDKWMSYQDELKPYFSTEDSSEKIDKSEFIDYLEELASASEMLDLDVMDPIAKILEGYSVPWKGGQDKLNNLLAAIVDLDTDAIFSLVTELKMECEEAL